MGEEDGERERERKSVYIRFWTWIRNPGSILTSNGPMSDSNHRNAFRAECYISVHETFCHVDIPLCVHAYVADCIARVLHPEPGWIINACQAYELNGILKGTDVDREGESILSRIDHSFFSFFFFFLDIKRDIYRHLSILL